MKTWILPIVLGLFLIGGVYWKYQGDIESSKTHYIETSHNDSERLASRVEGKLSLVYQGMRTIANLPAMRVNSFDQSSLDANLLHSISDIYENLSKNVGVTGLYIFPSHSEIIGNAQHQIQNERHAHEPYLVINPEFQFHVVYEDMSSENYQVALTTHDQMEIFERDFSSIKGTRNIAYPAMASVGDEGGKTPSLIYSLPIYGRGGSLKGVITASIPLDKINEILEPSGDILVHKGHQHIIAPGSAGIWSDAMQWVKKAEADPGLIYSEVLSLGLPDISGEWALWSARPDKAYWSGHEVRSARNFMISGIVLSILLTVGLIVFLKMTKRQQQMIRQKNIELEIKVHERTGELKKALHASEEVAQALGESEEKNRMVVSSAVDGMIAIDQMGTIMSFNPAAETIFGYSADNVTGHKVEMLMPEPDRGNHDSYLHNYNSTGKRKVIGIGPREVVALRKNGQTFPMDLAISEMIIGGKRQFLAIVRDITERKRAEEALKKEKEEQKALIDQLQTAQGQLMQSEKMASIGQLAAGVAHEINNPVGYINSNMGSLEKYVKDLFTVLDTYEEADPVLKSDANMYQRVQAIKEQVDLGYLKEDIIQLMKESQEGVKRVKRIVQDLKDFSHVDEAEWQWTDLHKGMDSTLNIVNNDIKYKAEVVKEYGKLPDVECIPSQINQVFLNLLVNASQAIETRGVITVRSGVEGDQVWIGVSDSGKGIPKENLQRIFDPFFTTKPIGKGTGLGLSLSFGIIKKHHGRIEVESEVGKGTTFRIWLPVKQGDGKEPIPVEKPAGNTPELVTS